MPKNGFSSFSENRAPSHFGHCHFESFCQKSEKTNEPISRKAGNRRRDGQRLIWDLRGRSNDQQTPI